MRHRIGLVTCSKLPASAAEDDLLRTALEDRGHVVESVVWDGDSSWREMDTLVFRSVWNYHLHIERFDRWLDEIEQSPIRSINAIALMRWNSRKSYLLDLHRVGVPVIDTILATESTAVSCWESARAMGWDHIVVKPIVGASAHGIRKLARTQPTTDFPSNNFLLQPFLAEVASEGEWSLVYFDGVYSHAVLKRPGLGDFRVQVEHGGHSSVGEPNERVRAAGDQAISALPDEAVYARIDLVETTDGPKVMEVELIEPELFLGVHPNAAFRLADAIERRLIC